MLGVKLTNELQSCVCIAVEGHNFLITEKAGTGKSCVVCEIDEHSEQLEK